MYLVPFNHMPSTVDTSRSILWKKKSMLPSILAIFLWSSHCQSAKATDGNHWWTQARLRHMTSSPVTFLKEQQSSNSMPTSLRETCTRCSVILQLSSSWFQMFNSDYTTKAIICFSKYLPLGREQDHNLADCLSANVETARVKFFHT